MRYGTFDLKSIKLLSFRCKNKWCFMTGQFVSRDQTGGHHQKIWGHSSNTLSEHSREAYYLSRNSSIIITVFKS